jgi:hypothetical protein
MNHATALPEFFTDPNAELDQSSITTGLTVDEARQIITGPAPATQTGELNQDLHTTVQNVARRLVKNSHVSAIRQQIAQHSSRTWR